MSKPKFVPIAQTDDRPLETVLQGFREQGYSRFRFRVANGGLWLVCTP